MSLQLLRKGLRLPIQAVRPLRRLSTTPPHDPTGPLESIIGLSAFFVVCLGPSAYILVNLESYKKK